MPSPAICVVAVVAGVAAGLAFKEFVYDPHLAPKIEEWTGVYAAYRNERRRRRASPHSQARSDGDDKRRHSLDGKSSPQFEGLIEREMHTFDRGGTLRKRRPGTGDQNGLGLEMIEKPNAFIPFAPLSPTPAAQSNSPPPPNPFSSRSETALPIGRLPTPISDRAPSPPQSEHMAPSPRVLSPPSQLHLASPFELPPSLPHSPSFSEAPSLVSAPASNPGDFEYAFPHSDSRAPSRTSYLGPSSEFDFVQQPSASVSRSITPFTDTHSETSFTDARSEVSLDDFLGSEADSDAEFLRPPSPARGYAAMSEAGSEDWERVSEAGGNAGR